jgi:hypothetical protein
VKYDRKIVQYKSNTKYSPNPYVWDEELKRKAPCYALVYTKNGLEYKGVPVSWTVRDTPKELLLAKPKMVIRDDNLDVIVEFEMGDSILFLKEDIARVVHL